jgi:hypothetical protein
MSRAGSDARGTLSGTLAFFRRHTRIGPKNQRLASDVQKYFTNCNLLQKNKNKRRQFPKTDTTPTQLVQRLTAQTKPCAHKRRS